MNYKQITKTVIRSYKAYICVKDLLFCEPYDTKIVAKGIDARGSVFKWSIFECYQDMTRPFKERRVFTPTTIKHINKFLKSEFPSTRYAKIKEDLSFAFRL